VTWEDGQAVAIDLYYDPVLDEHVASPMGLTAPVWYLAPQRRDVAESAWRMEAAASGILDDDNPVGLRNPNVAVMLAWHTGEFTDGPVKSRLWDYMDRTFEPTWDLERGEFTFGFCLDEPHPRGQLNARAMAGWVCTPGAWSQIFSEVHPDRFDGPVVTGVDFPRVALSEARWTGSALHLTPHPQNPSIAGTRTSLQVDQLPSDGRWRLTGPEGETTAVEVSGGSATLELSVDGQSHRLQQR
tara:strand:- start:994 stop:1719 length:726 start_codon:yes stop_codon:yes gene_type:complete